MCKAYRGKDQRKNWTSDSWLERSGKNLQKKLSLLQTAGRKKNTLQKMTLMRTFVTLADAQLQIAMGSLLTDR